MATKKDAEQTSTEEEYPAGVARPAAEDPTLHVEAWPEAYNNPLVEGEAEPKHAPARESKDS